MKILCFAHTLDFGGTQVNAIELAAALRDLHHHDVALFATPGPMLRFVQHKDLKFLPAPDARFHPSAQRMRALRDAVRQERPDLIHVWDWWQCLEAYYAVHLWNHLPIVVTDMMMDLTRVLPKELPTTFGTPKVVDQAKAAGRRRVQLILPPVDLSQNAPGMADGDRFREQHGICEDEIVVVTVSRLSKFMKSESLFQTVEAVRDLAREMPLRFLIVGEGSARTELDQLADKVNQELKRTAITLIGGLVDPRPAYAAADIVVGMGSSALRGMAFGKPVIVVGERCFSAPFTPETAPYFYYEGLYGIGDNSHGSTRLLTQIRDLAESSKEERKALGQFSMQFVTQHFSLERAAALLSDFCERAIRNSMSFTSVAVDGLRTASVYLRERRFSIPSRPKYSDRQSSLIPSTES